MKVIFDNADVLNAYNREQIERIIRAESNHLPESSEIAIFHDSSENKYALSIKVPGIHHVCRNLYDDMGDFTPAIFRLRFRELMKLL